jgi:hypothetical protein
MMMAKRDQPPKAKDERARAVRRLKEVVTARRHLRNQQVTANGNSANGRANAVLRVAADQVTAPKSRLNRVDERAD